MQTFTPLSSLLGGALVGLAASLLLLTHGRVAGISGLFGGLFQRDATAHPYRFWFIGGLLAAGALALAIHPAAFGLGASAPPWALVVAGLLVGYGTRLGNGCTSGHGICGLSRLSARSLVATLTFMATGGVTVFVVKHVLGGLR